ncbi:CCA tRNA nucleotidyltransferase [bacterium]|nr:CCA tRNA nucleotidyltransferase [bacterium]
MSTQIKTKISNDEYLNKIKSLTDADIYVVGGTVRDYLLDKTTYDRDLIVDGESTESFAKKIAENLDGTFITLDSENNIYRVVLKDKLNYFDITNPVENNLTKDLFRRDLTINAIAVNIKTLEVIDLCGGISDINNKILHVISEENIKDDPLRILRTYRFQALLGFEIERDTINFICNNVNLIANPAAERINYELLKLFSGKFAAKTLENMDKTWLLEQIFPFVKELKQVPPNSHHHLDLFNHSIETVNQIQFLYENSNPIIKEHLDSVDFGGCSRLAHLKLAGFMHDIGKFSTWTIEEDTGRHRFIKHDDVGSKIAAKFLKNMKFSNKQIEYISSMIKNHIYPSQVMCAPEVNDKIMMRFVRKMDKNSIDNIYLAMADRLSARGPEISEDIVNTNLRNLNKLLEFYLDKKDSLKPLPILLDGNDVMKILNIKPSPELGKIMNMLHEEQLNGEILTREDAVLYIKSIKF